MNIKDLIDELSLYDGRYKRELVDEALARREEITPHLLALLEAVRDNPRPYAEDDSFFGHLYAALLLGHWRETSAHRLIIDIFSLPGDLPEELFGDALIEDLPGLLLNTCGGNLESLKAFAENQAAGNDCRASALQALSYAVVTGDLDRAEAVAYFQGLVENALDGSTPSLVNETACCLLELFPEESMALIERAYDRGLIDPTYVSREDFARQLDEGREDTLGALAAQWLKRNPADFHKRMAWWACFDQESPTHPMGRPRQDDRKHQQRRKMKKKARRKMAKTSRRKTRQGRKK
jgi:hypothetical protein